MFALATPIPKYTLVCFGVIRGHILVGKILFAFTPVTSSGNKSTVGFWNDSKLAHVIIK